MRYFLVLISNKYIADANFLHIENRNLVNEILNNIASYIC